MIALAIDSAADPADLVAEAIALATRVERRLQDSGTVPRPHAPAQRDARTAADAADGEAIAPA